MEGSELFFLVDAACLLYLGQHYFFICVSFVDSLILKEEAAMNNDTSGQPASELDLQEILKKSEQQADFPDVPLDEFIPPTYEEWKENCIALLKGAPFDKKMYTKTFNV